MLFTGFPVWWVLGLTQVAILLFCAVMVVRLPRWRHLVAPWGFRLWLLFLVWAALGGFVLQAGAPGAGAGDGSSRYLTWGLRLIWYLEATVVLLYVANIRKWVSIQRLARVFAVMFVIIAAGGLIGTLTPLTSFRSLAEYVLPARLSGNGFVSSLIHSIVEPRSYLTHSGHRPSARFPAANEWAVNYLCFVPIFVYAWFGKTARWRRYAAPVVLLASLVPAGYSFNRYMGDTGHAAASWTAVISAAKSLPVVELSMAILGGLFGLAFFVLALWRHRRRREPAAAAYLCTLLVFVLAVPVFGWSVMASFAAMAAIASLGSIAANSTHARAKKPFLAESLRPIRGLAQPRLVVVCCLAGAIAGAGWQVYRGPTYVATAAVHLPATPTNSGLEPGAESTLDTQARMIAAQGPPGARHHNHETARHTGDRLNVSAEPNSRIIKITYQSANAHQAVRGAEDVSRAAIRHRSARLKRERATLLTKTHRESNGISTALKTIHAGTQTLGGAWVSPGNAVAVSGMRHKRAELKGRATTLGKRANMLKKVSIQGGHVTKPASVHTPPQRWNLAITSGAALGLLVAVLIADYRRARGARLDRLSDAELGRTLRGQTIFRLGPTTRPIDIRRELAAPTRSTEAICVGPRSTRLCTITDSLNQEVASAHGSRTADSPDPGTSVIAVASPKIRTSQLVHQISGLRQCGIQVAGVVVADQ